MNNKKILIVGASSGIGKTTALLLAEKGANLVLFSRNLEKLNEVILLCNGKNHQIFSVDVTDEYALNDALLNSVKDRIPYDGVVYSAGMEATIPSKLLKNEYLDKVMKTNTYPVINIAKFLQKKNNYNPEATSFVIVSSVMGMVGQVAKVAYSMSKHALSGIAKSLAMELASKNIRINCVLPGMVKTDMAIKILESISEENKQKIENMHPLGLGTALDVANSIEFLLSEKSKWITGINLPVDGGYTAH